MNKFFFWVLLIIAVVVYLRRRAAAMRAQWDLARARAQAGMGPLGGRGAQDFDRSEDTSHATPDVMMSCAVCGVHLPASEAIFAHGHVYCSEEHLAKGKAMRAEQRLK